MYSSDDDDADSGYDGTADDEDASDTFLEESC